MGTTLIHIDEHSDLWENKNILPERGEKSGDTYLENIWKFTNYACNVGNYITPARNAWLIDTIMRIEGEYDIDQALQKSYPTEYILNLDMDFFSEELDYIDYEKKKACITHFAKHARLITIATSPGFMDQAKAIRIMRDIFYS